MREQAVRMFTSDPELNRRISWAERQALAYAQDEAPIGPVYEAALPGRAAFCMRDVSHQALGAQALGLGKHNYNMMRHFMRGISETRDYCSFWEIGFDGKPCPVDYTDDRDFWYNLPANFDVMDACLRLFHWTGDRRYLSHPDFANFHQISVRDYVRRWDRDRDGMVDARPADGRRGVGSYDESPRQAGYRVAADTLASQYAAYRAFAAMLDYDQKPALAAEYREKAADLAQTYRQRWWDEKEQRFASVWFGEERYGYEYLGMNHMMPIYFGMVEDPAQREAQLRLILSQEPENVEEGSYMAEFLWSQGLDREAMAAWLRMTDTTKPRREYPEVSYAALGALVSGYLGIRPDAAQSSLMTRSAVPEGAWAQAEGLPLWGGTVSLLHEGSGFSRLHNQTGRLLKWLPAGIKQAIEVPHGAVAEYTARKT